MKRVLLTGASGFVGSHTLVHFLLNTDWEIVIIVSFRHKGLTDRLRQMIFDTYPEHWPRVKMFIHDMRVPFSPLLASHIGNIDYIVSMASESHVDRSMEAPRGFIEGNVAIVLTLLEYAREYPVEKFIQISTDEVYGPAPEGHNHKEGEPHRPSNPYSASKSAQESICYAYWRTYSMPIVITNTMNIIGELQDSEKFIPKTIKAVLNDQVVTVHANADGSKIGSRFYLHARNQADALLFILNNVQPSLYGDSTDIMRFNVVGERELTNLEVAELIAKFAGKKLKYELVDFHSSRPGHDLRYALDGTKLAVAGWKPPIPLEESLKKTVEWTIKHPEWII